MDTIAGSLEKMFDFDRRDDDRPRRLILDETTGAVLSSSFDDDDHDHDGDHDRDRR